MKKNKITFTSLSIALCIAFLLSGCGGDSTATPTKDTKQIFTEVAGTIQAGIGMTQTLVAAQQTPTPAYTATLPASPTPAVSGTPTVTPSRAAGGVTATVTACDMAGFVSDVTIPDGTEILGGNTFKKTWRLRNDGTCTWNSNYKLTFYSGTQMGGAASSQLTTGTVAPGGTIDISLDMVSPTTAGTYYGYWVLTNAKGVNFGIGSAGNAFYLKIVVKTIATYTPTAKTVTATATATATTKPATTSTATATSTATTAPAPTSTSTATTAPASTETSTPTAEPSATETLTATTGG